MEPLEPLFEVVGMLALVCLAAYIIKDWLSRY